MKAFRKYRKDLKMFVLGWGRIRDLDCINPQLPLMVMEDSKIELIKAYHLSCNNPKKLESILIRLHFNKYFKGWKNEKTI